MTAAASRFNLGISHQHATLLITTISYPDPLSSIGPECGASAFDRAFLAFLYRVIEIPRDEAGSYGGGKGGHTIVERTERLILDKAESIKHAFGGANEPIGAIELPTKCRLLDTEFARSRVPHGTRSLQMTQ